MTEFIQLKDRWTVIGPIGDAPGMSTVTEVEREGQRAVIKKVVKIKDGSRDLLAADLGGCRNILPFDEIFENETEILLRMPKAEGSLNQRLESAGKLSESDTISALTDITQALADMGEIVVHRDIKPQNILRYDGAWRLADFGIARYTEDPTATRTFKGHGSTPWIAPERLLGQRATIKSDVYSLGIVAYQLVTGDLPFKGPDFYEQHQSSPPPIPGEASPLLRSLILSMLAKSPAARPNPDQILVQLATAGKKVSSPALSRLRELAGKSAEKISRADAAAAEEQANLEQRKILFESARLMTREFFDPIAEALGSIPGVVKSDTLGATHFKFESARLTLGKPSAFPKNDSIPFDTVCAGYISVEIAGTQDRWAGRAHSLWYCDAQNNGEYHWIETAFHNLYSRTRIEPYNREPSDRDAQLALSNVIHTEQVAMPFKILAGEALGEFVERWIDLFAQAAVGSLPRPLILPEGSPRGTWRSS